MADRPRSKLTSQSNHPDKTLQVSEERIRPKMKRSKSIVKASEQSAQQKEELHQCYKKSQNILKSLEEAALNEKSRHDEDIQKLEVEMQKALNLSQGSWIPEDKKMDEVVKILKERNKISQQIEMGNSLDDSVLLQKISGGALRGVLLTRHREDQLKDRECLLETPKGVSIMAESLSDTKIVQFSSAHQEENYKKTVDILGHSAAYGAANQMAENVAAQEEKHKKAYSSTVKYFTEQVASYSFEMKDLRLSREVKTELDNVLKLLKHGSVGSTNVKTACKMLFKKYGSHVNMGPLRFGGRIWWSCSSDGFCDEEAEIVQKMQQDIISSIAGFSFSDFGTFTEVNISKAIKNYKGKCSDNVLDNTHLQVRITGGPQRVTDLSLWKTGLVIDNRTWILIDRGGKLMPIWDIIHRNHEKELGVLKEVLQNAWEEMSGLKAEQNKSPKLSYNPDTVLAKVNVWREKEVFSSHEVEEYLGYLLQVKKDILKAGNRGIWTESYLSDPNLQEFLESVVYSVSSRVEHIKPLMKELIELEDLSHFDTYTFQQVSEWLYDLNQPLKHSNTQYFQSFTNFLTKYLKGINTTQSSVLKPKEKTSTEIIAAEVSKQIHALRNHCRDTYDDILITILVHPFLDQGDYESVMTLNPLSPKDLKFMHKQFSERRVEFDQYLKKKQPLHLQAYLFKLAVDLNGENEELHQFLHHIKQMMRALQPPLERELEECLDKYASSPKLLLRNLQKILNKKVIRQPSMSAYDSNANSLRNVLKVKMIQNTELPHDLSQMKSHPTVYSLFETLDLTKFYPKKLQLKDALCIRPKPLKVSLSETHPTDPKDLPFLVLHKLMVYDILCRSDLMPPKLTSADEYDDEYGDNDDEYGDNDDDDDGGGIDGIHPVDIILALLLCSDDFLHQDLLSRLAKCQLSIPFVLPDPFTKQLTIPLWALQSIIKDWKSTKAGGEIEPQTHPIVNYPMPIISFIGFRKQKQGKSKSILLNDVISGSHSHFFHRDCPGGQYKCLLGQGMVDMSWYLPAGKPADFFPDAITFLNLHGDAKQHPQQCKFLGQISSMCFVLLTEEVKASDAETISILRMFSSCPGGITLLDNVGKNPKAIRDAIPGVQPINLTKKNTNASEITRSIREQIKGKLGDFKQTSTIEECCKFRGESIKLDADNSFHKEGLTLATELRSIITDQAVSTKEAILPLQCKSMWQAWAAEDRELHRQIHRGTKTVNNYTAEIERKKVAIRKEQLKHVDSLKPAMESFIRSLLKLGGHSNSVLRNYFLQCLKLELNNISRLNISEKQLQYQDIKRELTKLQDKSDSRKNDPKNKERQSLIDKHKSKMKELQDEIINASVGLEHLFRELGQVYEAATESPRYGSELSRLPKAVAELLIDGYPLEVMDGDAAHVPRLWVTAVFNEAVKMLKNPKIFVLSVLGLQSTGKSTMLNTAFGLQFNVSAGRCTRGAFIQLLPLDEELKRTTKCSYVLVVDTEGLRAPELDPLKTQKHDNELATFVIGLANMTLINIYGEVPGDMDDILQTSVHAFLRMTQVKYHPSCQFVHQNAGSNVKSEVGRSKFTEKLNKFTVDAAREEHCEGQYETFNDVIMFNDQKDVHHFPGLWKGDPPMAPVNQGYSHSAQMLKQSCIEILDERLSKGRNVGDLRLSSFHGKIGELWKTLLKENFVFSFKNTLEITAYNSLETEYSKWEWTFHEGMLEWERKAENDITTAKAKDVPKVVDRKCDELKKYVHNQLFEPLKSKMDDFFRGSQAEILVQWEQKFNLRLFNLSLELQEHAEKHCNKLRKRREAISKIESVKTEYTKNITRKVQDYIATLKEEQEKLNQNLEIGKLESSQLKKILKNELFTSEKMDLYEHERLLTPDQVTQIKVIINRNQGKLTEGDLNFIMTQVLGIGQIKKIMKMGQQKEEQLKDEFDGIWKEIVKELPQEPGEKVNVAKEVEGKLTDFVRNSQGQLIKLLQERSLSHVATLQFHLVEDLHFKKVKGGIFSRGLDFITRIVGGEVVESFPHHIEALEITNRVLSVARVYLEHIEKKDTDFNTAFTQELLHRLDVKITEELAATKDRLTFTREYRLDVYMTACGYAIPKFKKMSDSFKERHDPRRNLENDIKGPLFAKFKSQYYQAEAEEAIASTLCAHLEEPIKIQIRKKMSSKMVGLMKASDSCFSSKMALKVKILTSLKESNRFEDYMHYVKDVKGCLESWIKRYTIEFCDKVVGDQSTRLQVATKEEVKTMVRVVENKVNDLTESNVKQWIEVFADDDKIRTELGVNLSADNLLEGYEDLELNLDNLKEHIKTGLKYLEQKLHSSYNNICCKDEMKHWKDKPHDHLEPLIGCTEQCPFCGEQCDLQDPDHVSTNRDHSVSVHRSTCLQGYKNRTTRIMSTGFCPAYISGKEHETRFSNSKTNHEFHPYKEYKKIYPDWSIPPDVTSEDSMYWKSFVANHMERIATKFKAKPAVVPDSWSKLTWEEIRENLKSIYNY